MFFDIGPLEVVTLIVLAVVLVGPDKLPKMVSDTVRTLRKVRELSQSAQAGIRSELPAEFQDLALEDLNPKTLVAKTLGAENLDLTGLAADLDVGLDLEAEPPGTSAGPGPASTTADHRP
ncbi:Sec-independent protein translocase subunit TatB [Streptomyces sp. NPDC001070]